MAVSVVGFDIGTLSSYVVVARQGGIETVANEYTDRNTPTFVSFNDKMRFIGHEAKQQQVTNIPNTIYNYTAFLGKYFNDKCVQEEIQKVPYKVISLPDNRIGIQVTYLGEETVFTPEQLLAMHLTKLKEVAEMNLNTKVVDVVLNVPNCATDSERRAVLDAAQIANLNCVRLINDTTAAAIAYGIYSQDLPEPEQNPKHVAFIDMGYSTLNANIVAFNKSKMRVVTSMSSKVGGRDFDRVLYDHVKAEFLTKYKLEVIDGKKPSIRLMQECEKLKKLMSANSTEIPLNIECFMNDVDVSARMKRQDFEELCSPMLNKIMTALATLLKEAKLQPEDISSVELVGGSTRIPSVKQIVSNIFKKDGRTSLNADEAVARGCAVQCAIVSPAFKVKDFAIQDACNYSISLSYKDDDKTENLEVYPKWHNYPASRQLTFYRTESFVLEAKYTNPNDIPSDKVQLGTFCISGVKPTATGEAAKVKVKVRVNANGIFTVSQAQIVETVEKQVEVEVEAEPEVSKHASPDSKSSQEQPKPNDEGEKMEVDSTTENETAKNGDVNMNAPEEKKENPEKPTVDKPKKVKKMVTKNVTNHIDLPLNEDILQYSVQKINEFNEKENQMIMQVKLEKERASAKNSVEEYVYEMRDKLYGDFEKFINDADRESFSSLLSQTENWLYEEGEDESKQVYIDRLNEMKKFGDPVVLRAREASLRPIAINEFSRVAVEIQKVITSVENKEEAYNHLSEEEVKTLVNVLNEQQLWFTQEVSKQRDRKESENPVLLVTDIYARKTKMENIAGPIVSKPKPVVTPPQDPKTSNNAQESADVNSGDQKNNNQANMEDNSGSNDKAATDMDLD